MWYNNSMRLDFQYLHWVDLPKWLDVDPNPKPGTFGAIVIQVEYHELSWAKKMYKPVFNSEDAKFWLNYFRNGGFTAHFEPAVEPVETMLPYVEPVVPDWPEEKPATKWWKRPVSPYTPGGLE